jgi:O-antigen/teichoic acid export membrane protein
MSLKRILKLLAAFLTGQGIGVVSQLLVPPLFLHRYPNGLQVYGEWIALSAAVAYLNTLNYGIQNYSNNQMALHYTSGQIDEARAVQASAFRLLLEVVSILSVLASGIFLLPIARWLRLEHVSATAACWTVFLLVLQLLCNWCFGFVAYSYMVIGQAHRGQNWLNAQRLVAVLAVAALLWNRASFPVLALAQLCTVAVFTILVIIEMRIRVPILLPALHHGSWSKALSLVKPTGYFMLLSVSAFLTWQGPILVIQNILGSTAVAVFALSRIVFSMSRQLLLIFTFAISQDITHLVGQKSWSQLRRLYELSEKVILLLVPSVTVGTLLLSPFLFTVWLHNRDLYQPALCFLMAAISAVMGIKEHKYQFQWSSNRHTSLSKFMLGTYCIMLTLTALLLKPFGLRIFLGIWLVTEIMQLRYILKLNARLFPPEAQISVAPVYRLAGVLVISFAAAVWPCWHSPGWPLVRVVVVAVVYTAILAIISYFAFDLSEVVGVLLSKVRSRATASL